MLENQLLKGLKEGKNWAFAAVYKNHFNLVYKLVIKNSGTLADAKDLMQDTLYAIVQNTRKPSFKLSAKFSSYLYSIAENIWLMKLRKKRTEPRPLSGSKGPMTTFQPIEEPSLAQKNEEEQELDLVARMLEEMGDKCKKIIKEFYYKKTPLEQIAILTNLTPGSVKVTKHRCVKTLKDKVLASKEYHKSLSEK